MSASSALSLTDDRAAHQTRVPGDRARTRSWLAWSVMDDARAPGGPVGVPVTPAAVVFLEGASDVAAARALAATREVSLERVRLVDLGGVTNLRRALARAAEQWPDAQPLGLCDAGEAHVAEGALRARGLAVRDASDLPAYGFFVCRRDLEEELIRALGTARTVDVVSRLGLGPKLVALQQQPAWVDRPVAEQLHRFCGVASGRKELLARALAQALTPDEVPEPLGLLLDRIAHA